MTDVDSINIAMWGGLKNEGIQVLFVLIFFWWSNLFFGVGPKHFFCVDEGPNLFFRGEGVDFF